MSSVPINEFVDVRAALRSDVKRIIKHERKMYVKSVAREHKKHEIQAHTNRVDEKHLKVNFNSCTAYEWTRTLNFHRFD